MKKTDILIIGSGIAGLFFAIKIAKKRPDLSIAIMTKDKVKNSNTQLAQGGIAVVTDCIKDSFEQHIADTLQSGGGLCDEEIVKMVIHQAPERLKELIDIGVSFDKNKSGIWNLGLEGGHSQHRILHHKDISGAEIEKNLIETIKQLSNITVLEDHLVIDVDTKKSNGKMRCTGAFYCDKINKKVKYIRTKTVVLSTGGCGQIFKNTTNPEIATGDGIAIASRAGAVIKDMQYIQFHPTALYEEDKNPFFLISEAVRGFGAHIVNENQKRFIFKDDIRGELATRDIVSQAISKEIETSGKQYVYLDCRHLDFAEFYRHFPSITDYCKTIGLHPERDLIPIVPVAHYQCGGISVNKKSQTNIKNLYAIGECSRTGLHGKNRLASNSLLEALVFAHQASDHIGRTIDDLSFSSKKSLLKFDEPLMDRDSNYFVELKKELQTMMTFFFANKDSDFAPILNRIESMKMATVGLLFKKQKITTQLIEFTNMLTVAKIIVEQNKTEALKNVTSY
ncbi:L-aspartate oxidase [Flavobacterium piscisymbiosum]|uniref:L-aspartate oxidase n=1 Tax=Flavobacterium piscisymbiosum TaxID=2893753 RepID=A0ABS8ML25_9FLAO|nr:L-aspartate oxidase [Flavobacterium sp. F-30]MCC9066190.1 L-aspartate oxidase [Flavobacterium sp. F-30]